MFFASSAVEALNFRVPYFLHWLSALDTFDKSALPFHMALSPRYAKFDKGVHNRLMIHAVNQPDIGQGFLLFPVQARQEPLIPRNNNAVVSCARHV